MPAVKNTFSRDLVAWQLRHGRHDLPWQGSRDPYRIWLSEIMLQQTQVTTVIPYFNRFLERFPTLASLAGAQQDEVLRLWAGLGYYTRARNLHLAARYVVDQWGGQFPRSTTELESLPGVGRSTAAAIAVFAFGHRAAILDGNVRRVLARHAAISGNVREQSAQQTLWEIAEARLPSRSIEAYTQGLMDLGATICTNRVPRCGDCPVARSCAALALGEPTAFPVRAPRASRTARAWMMIVVRRGKHILLLRRPPQGIWASMWCLPAYDRNADWRALLARETAVGTGAGMARAQPLTPVNHELTHLSLSIEPIELWIKYTVGVPTVETRWVTLTEALDMGLPVAVRRILQAIDKPA